MYFSFAILLSRFLVLLSSVRSRTADADDAEEGEMSLNFIWAPYEECLRYLSLFVTDSVQAHYHALGTLRRLFTFS